MSVRLARHAGIMHVHDVVTFRGSVHKYDVQRGPGDFAPRDDESAFRSIYERNASHVYRFALSLGVDPPDAEEIMAETFARAFTSAVPIREQTARAYLMTIARRCFLETRRRRSRETDLAPSLSDRQSPPDARIEHWSELVAVRGRLDQLPDIDRAALLMRAVHEMSYEDVARSLGISVVAAKVKVHRARRSLAALIRRSS